MGKVFVFMNDQPSGKKDPILPDVYCPQGGYEDKNLGRRFDSKGEKYRYLKSKGMKEAEVFRPGQSIGGNEGRATKRSGDRGNFRASGMPGWMKAELSKIARGA